jgi:hypothetical protein
VNVRTFLSVFLMTLAPAAAFAVPVNYTFNLGATTDNFSSGGTGSFFWDADTHELSNLTWDFGNGLVGGAIDAAQNWGSVVFGGTRAEFAFEIFTGQDVHPSGCGTGPGCGVTFSGSGVFGSLALVEFGVGSGFVRNFNYAVSANDWPCCHSGTLATATVSPTSEVPEPGTVSLLIGAISALALTRRRRIRTGASAPTGTRPSSLTLERRWIARR